MSVNENAGRCPIPALTWLLLSLLVMGSWAQAEIYRWTDAQGRIQLSDKPPLNGGAEQVNLNRINTFEGVSVDEYEAVAPVGRGNSKRVIMYSTSWCGVCRRAKTFFQEKGIGYNELDIEKSGKARNAYDRLGARGVPVILVGNKRMNGFSAKRFMTLYEE